MTRPRTVYIISDLHLGGDRDFRMMTRPDRLAELVATIANADASTDKQELVINGDFVDFLAEVDHEDEHGSPRWEPFIADPQQAADRFDKIAGTTDPTAMDAPVFDALAGLLERGHRLTVLPGNHDVELCLPAVRRALLARLRYRPGHDLHVQHDGEGYVIGDALVEHGNRYDESNFIDHERLHNLRVKQSLRQSDASKLPFAAPLGSYFVARVMNEIKRTHPFVDLLKPEGPALASLLLAIDPDLRDRVVELAQMTWAHRRGHSLATEAWTQETAFRGSGPRGVGDPSGADGPGSAGELLGETLREVLDDEWVAEPADTGADPADSGPRLRGGGTRGGWRERWQLLNDGGWEVLRLLVNGRIKEVKRFELLRQAVRKMGASPAFDRGVDEPGSPYLAAARTLAHPRGFRFVIFGHTHHAKDIALDGGARYLNSGTWANLMCFPPALFDAGTDEPTAEDVLRRFVDDLGHHRLDQHVRFLPTYVRLRLGGDGHVREAELGEP